MTCLHIATVIPQEDLLFPNQSMTCLHIATVIPQEDLLFPNQSMTCLHITTVIPQEPECEGWIAKYVQRTIVWHHKACLVMTNGDCEGLIFLFHPHTNNGFFSYSPYI